MTATAALPMLKPARGLTGYRSMLRLAGVRGVLVPPHVCDGVISAACLTRFAKDVSGEIRTRSHYSYLPPGKVSILDSDLIFRPPGIHRRSVAPKEISADEKVHRSTLAAPERAARL